MERTVKQTTRLHKKKSINTTTTLSNEVGVGFQVKTVCDIDLSRKEIESIERQNMIYALRMNIHMAIERGEISTDEALSIIINGII